MYDIYNISKFHSGRFILIAFPFYDSELNYTIDRCEEETLNKLYGTELSAGELIIKYFQFCPVFEIGTT